MAGKYNIARNFGYGKSVAFALRNAHRATMDPARYPSLKTSLSKLKPFIGWCRDNGINDLAFGDPQLTLEEYAFEQQELVVEEEIEVGTAQNRLSAVNVAFHLLTGHHRYEVSPAQYVGKRSYARTEPPDGMDIRQVEALVDDLKQADLARVAAGVMLARFAGLRREEFCLARLDRWRREAPSGGVYVIEGTKGGPVPGRWVSASPRLKEALRFALEVRPRGSCNLLAPDERYKNFKHGEVQRARPILKKHGINSYKELRAAYACDRYEQITGHPAPALQQGLRTADRDSDKSARYTVSKELGHRREQITESYYGRARKVTSHMIGAARRCKKET